MLKKVPGDYTSKVWWWMRPGRVQMIRHSLNVPNTDTTKLLGASYYRKLIRRRELDSQIAYLVYLHQEALRRVSPILKG
jgi:hypothetical protein